MLNEGELIQDTITKICSYYSKSENVNGILKVENVNEFGMKNIGLIIIYGNSISVPNYFGFNNGSNKFRIEDNVIVSIESKEAIEFGLLARYFFDKGEPSAYCFLAEGDILYDRTGEYHKLKNGGNLIKTRTNSKRIGVPVNS